MFQEKLGGSAPEGKNLELITSYANQKVADYLIRESPTKVCMIFWHGLGDLIMFWRSLEELRGLFPDITIDIALQEGVGQEELIPDAILITSPNEPIEGYDYTFQVHFPMCEHMAGSYTKQGWCCTQELGIDPVDKYPVFKPHKNKLVACHFQATALPDPVNPSYETAKEIWSEIIEAGFIPIEALFKHKYYNPVNEKFDFIDCTIRSAKPSINTLIGLYQHCAASICCASGNLPLSIAVMPEKTLYLKKAFGIKCYTREAIDTIDINDYAKGNVKKWLAKL